MVVSHATSAAVIAAPGTICVAPTEVMYGREQVEPSCCTGGVENTTGTADICAAFIPVSATP